MPQTRHESPTKPYPIHLPGWLAAMCVPRSRPRRGGRTVAMRPSTAQVRASPWSVLVGAYQPCTPVSSPGHARLLLSRVRFSGRAEYVSQRCFIIYIGAWRGRSPFP